jgi:PKD repeat protein
MRSTLSVVLTLVLVSFIGLGRLQAQTEVIIDNGDSRTSSTGTWPVSGGTSPYGANSVWSRDGSTYSWNFTPSETGSYEVFMWWSGWSSRSTSVPVDIHHLGGTTRVVTNQLQNAGQWNSLGTFSFNSGVAYSITITSQKYPTSTCADAVKFVNTAAPPNSPPVATDDAFAVYQNTIDNALDVLANDTDPDAGDTMTITAVSAPNHGGAVVINAAKDGLIYTPASEFAGTETFTYTIEDASEATDQASVTVTVNEAVEAVIIDNGDPGTTYTGTWPASGGTSPFGANSLWSRDGATYSWTFTPPQAGDYEVFMWWSGWSSRSPSVPVDIQHQGGTTRVVINQLQNAGKWNSLGTFSFAAATSYKVTITAQKYPTSTCADAVKFSGMGQNSPPVAGDDAFTVSQDSQNNTLSVLANDSDPDAGDSITISAVGTPDQGGSVAVNGTGDALVYSPAAGFIGTETFSYTIKDTEEATDQATVTISVSQVVVNHPPVANDDAFTVNENSQNNTLNVLANDTDQDAGDTLTITAVGATSQGGSVSINPAKDRLIYTPATGFDGTETFSYTIQDPDAASDTATVTMTVNALPVNNPPNAVNDSYTVNKGSQNNSFAVLANDSDPDAGDTISISAVGTPNHGGSVTINAQKTAVVYTPAFSYTGIETFTYTIRDVAGATDQATVTVTVQSGGTQTEDIYIAYIYAHGWSTLESALRNMGAQQVNSDLWQYENTALNKDFRIHFVRDQAGVLSVMKTEGTHLILAGHANYGLGPLTPATEEEKRAAVIYNVYYIDEPRIINISGMELAVSVSGLQTGQAYPNWLPIFQDGTSGVLPWGFENPNRAPAFNYYMSYQPPGDSTHYIIETAHNARMERHVGSGVTPWFSSTGAIPDRNNPDHIKYFVAVPSFFVTEGTWIDDTVLPGFYGSGYSYAPPGTGTNVASYHFRILQSGNYNVSAWWPASADNTAQARYTTSYSGGSATVVKNQTIDGSEWNELGQYYFTPGGYKVQLSDQSVVGNVIADAVRVTKVGNVPAEVLNANFSTRSRAGTSPFNCRFSNMTIGDYSQFLWDFGDGTTDNLNKSPSHSYSQAGVYTVSLTVTGPLGTDVETKTGYIYVDQADPLLAEFSFSPQEFDVPQEVQFRDSSSGTPTSWSWSFGDGSTGSSQTARHTYTTAGLYTVSLRVTRSGGQTSTETKQQVVRACTYDKKIDNRVVNSHYAGKTCLFLKEKDIDNDELKYGRLFYDSCNTGTYYLDTLTHGLVYYTYASAIGSANLAYLEGYLQGMDDEELWAACDDVDPDKWDYYDFTQAPSTLTDSLSPLIPARSDQRRVPDIGAQLSPAREAQLEQMKNMSLIEAIEELKDVGFTMNRSYLDIGIMTALDDERPEAVAFALDSLRNPKTVQIEGETVLQVPDFLLAREILRVFSQESLPELIRLYDSGDPFLKRNVLLVLGGMPGEGIVRSRLIAALDDQSFWQDEEGVAAGVPLRVCDTAYNQLVLRYGIKNTPRKLGAAHSLETRDYHIDRLRNALTSGFERDKDLGRRRAKR